MPARQFTERTRAAADTGALDGPVTVVQEGPNLVIAKVEDGDCVSLQTSTAPLSPTKL